jgi:hypothetical protein
MNNSTIVVCMQRTGLESKPNKQMSNPSSEMSSPQSQHGHRASPKDPHFLFHPKRLEKAEKETKIALADCAVDVPSERD